VTKEAFIVESYHTGAGAAGAILEELSRFVGPLLERLDRQLDKRLVRTLLALMQAILMHRHREHGLLLSELGGYIVDDAHAPAGTKRLSNLLRSRKWDHTLLDDELWMRADAKVAEEEAAGRRALLIWDESAIEKSESIASADLCGVRSSKAARKMRIKPGFPAPPTHRPVFVPGLLMAALLLVGQNGPPLLAHLTYWTRRGAHAEEHAEVSHRLFRQSVERWGERVVHVCDRGYASALWVERFVEAYVDFVLRWRTERKLIDEKGERKAGRIAASRRSVDHRLLWDARRRCHRKVGIAYCPVHHPLFPDQPLWLVIGRPKNGNAWQFLTNQPVESNDDAWQVLDTYMRRWQVEMAFRYLKSELALESPRLWFWENRLKLLAVVVLVYAFLVSLLQTAFDGLRTYLFKYWCKRTGKRHRKAAMPLYRLRYAIVRLLLCHPLRITWQNPG
jgi:hypothetical protein